MDDDGITPMEKFSGTTKYGICNNVRGVSSIIVRYVANINHFKYHRNRIYCIDPGDEPSNNFYGIYE